MSKLGSATLSARVIALSAALTLAIIAIAFGLTYLSTQRILETQTAETVGAELGGLVERYEEGGVEELARAIADRAAGEPDAVYLLADKTGKRIVGNLDAWPDGVSPNGGWTRLPLKRGDQTIEVGARAYPVQADYRLLIGRDFAAQRRFSEALIEAGGLAVLASALLAAVAGYAINRMVMRRIGDIDQTARAIVDGDLTRRIPARGKDEFSRLAVTLNAMLERIETLVVELRAVTDSLAHDLRTPLTRLKTQISRANDPELDEKARRDAISYATDEADRVLAAFTAMIDLARAETGAAREQFSDLDLSELAEEVWELHKPLADDMGVELTFASEGAAPVRGHGQLLAQLVSNLLDNALKHAGEGKAIAVRIGVDHGVAKLEVSDRGPGIPEAQRTAALKRFGRLDDARSTPGSGLGLSLADTVARMHGGAVELADNAPGLIVRVTMPVRA